MCIRDSQLAENLGVPVVGASARSRKGLDELMDTAARVVAGEKTHPTKIRYTKPIESAIEELEPLLEGPLAGRLNSRWVALKLLEGDDTLLHAVGEYVGQELMEIPGLPDAVLLAKQHMADAGLSVERFKDVLVSCIVLRAEEMCSDAVFCDRACYNARDRKLDRILTSKRTGFPIMLALLLVVFWLTITGANYPSQWLADGLFWVQDLSLIHI